MKRNTVVLGITLFVLAAFAWAGWANYKYRQQAAERMLANASSGQLVAAGSTDDGGMTSSPLVGKPAPEFSLVDLSGKKVSLSGYKGKALLINFWATWCGPCKLETPWIIELRNQYAAQGFEVLGIDAENDDLAPNDTAGLAKEKVAVSQFVQQEHMPYPVLLDGDSITKTYGDFDAMPTSFYVDRNGTIVSAQKGISSKDDMEAKIRKIVGSK